MFKEKMPTAAGTRVAAKNNHNSKHTPGLVEQAMLQRDIDLELALAAVRDATDDAFVAVQSLMHLVRRKPSLRPRRRKEGELHAARTSAMHYTGPANATLTVAQQLHQIAYQLRVLESSVLRSPGR
jgi:NO-binding membrane sensor protein with MHYT domain